MRFSAKPWLEAQGASVVFNTEAAYYFLTDRSYREKVESRDWLYCDGVGLMRYLQLRTGRKVPRRHGPDIFEEYMRTAEGRRVLLLGGSGEAHDGIRRDFPEFFGRNHIDCETRLLPLDKMDAFAIELVAEQSYDDILIFLGLRRQEAMQDALHRAGYAGNSIGLGAAIDFLSGTKRRAGQAWQRLGLEWLVRMIAEPRMVPRVLRSAVLFSLIWLPQNASLEMAAEDIE